MSASNSQGRRTGVARSLLRATLALLLLAALGLFGALGLIGTIRRSGELIEAPEPDTQFTPATPRYDEDIFQNPRYLDRDRQIHYGTLSNLTVLESEETAPDLYAKLFYRYFQAIIHGDAETYRACFSGDFLSSTQLPDRFTMQMLYDIEISELNDLSGLDENGAPIEGKEFLVSYRILDNNGTFRDDLPPRASQKEHYKVLLNQSGAPEIDAIILQKDAARLIPRGLDAGKTAVYGSVLLFAIAFLIVLVYKTVKFLKKERLN